MFSIVAYSRSFVLNFLSIKIMFLLVTHATYSAHPNLLSNFSSKFMEPSLPCVRKVGKHKKNAHQLHRPSSP
jgi:hypothetical protein